MLYRKPEDAALLPAIRQIVDERPTYGYRRITALVNRALRGRGEPVVNAKRVLRIMQVHGLTLGRDLSARRYVYVWADGVYLQARLEEHAECMLVLIPGSSPRTATPEGKKELVGFQSLPSRRRGWACARGRAAGRA